MSTQTPTYGTLPTSPRRPRSTPPPRRRGRVLRWIALAVAIPTLAGGFDLWWFVLRHHAPAAVSLDQATAGVSAVEQGATTDVSGTWKVNRTITNADGTGSFAGFRVNENLVGSGPPPRSDARRRSTAP